MHDLESESIEILREAIAHIEIEIWDRHPVLIGVQEEVRLRCTSRPRDSVDQCQKCYAHHGMENIYIKAVMTKQFKK